jgi:leucine dehydrogenase
MEIFKLMQTTNCNEVVFFEEPSVDLRAIIAVNDTTLGQAITTCRQNYCSNTEAAAETALSMAYYNTIRAALLQRPFGGAGLTICGANETTKNEMFFRTLGVFINKWNGKIILARSSGISHCDMLDIKRETNYLLGIDERYINTNNSPVECIAKGMIQGIRAIVRKKLEAESLEGLSFVIQGVGEIGSNFIKELMKINGVKITVTDIIYDKIKVIQDHSPEIKVVKPTEIYKEKCDVFVSCAVNNLIKEEDTKQLDCKILTGSTNEFLFNNKVEKVVLEKEIFYVPGFIINGGEIIQLDNEYKGNDLSVLEKEISQIFNVTLELLTRADQQKKSISEVAFQTAREYIEGVATIKKLR